MSPSSPKRLWGGLLGIGLAAFAIWFGATMIGNPAQCDHKAMSVNDLCRHGYRSSERLIVDGALFDHSGRHRTLAEQISYNHIAGPLWVVGGVVLLGCSVWGIYTYVLARQADRQELAVSSS